MFILLFVVSVYAAGVLVVQLQALLAGSGFAVFRHRKKVLKCARRRITEIMDNGGEMEKTKTMTEETAPPRGQWREEWS